LPTTNYDINLGSLGKKYLTLHAAELWVETLVAQNTIATIGGRILVGPTTKLTRDIVGSVPGPEDTTIYVEHNQIASGDVLYMEANGQLEWIQATSGPSGVGPYSGNVRTGAAYNAYSEHWAIGNLNGVYGKASDTYGIGLGRYDTGYNYLVITDSNGVEFFDNADIRVGQLTGEAWTIGEVSASHKHINISADAIEFKESATIYGSLSATTWTLGAASSEQVVITSAAVQLKDASGNVQLELTSTPELIIGDNATGDYVQIDAGGIEFFSNSVKVIDMDASGNVAFGDVATNQGNMYWNNTSKILQFRGGTNGTDPQTYYRRRQY
jgi:hypothetical protein